MPSGLQIFINAIDDSPLHDPSYIRDSVESLIRVPGTRFLPNFCISYVGGIDGLDDPRRVSVSITNIHPKINGTGFVCSMNELLEALDEKV